MPANTSKVIHIGDVVSAKAREWEAYRREVTDIVLTAEEAERIEEINLKDPPKVVFKEQYGKAQSPETEIERIDISLQVIQYLIIRRPMCMGMIIGSKGPTGLFITESAAIGQRSHAEQHRHIFRYIIPTSL